MLPRLNIIALAAVLAISACARPSQPPATPSPETTADEHAGHHQHEGPEGLEIHGGHQMPMLPPVAIPENALITEADVRFMQMMIGHHGQAVHMTRLAEGAGASPRVLKLAQKIDLSQAGEIALMQGWLRDHGQYVPPMESWREMWMAGMLTPEQMEQLSAARGADFDKLFLRLMIAHHEGALLMVSELLNTPRAAQEVDVNVLANEIEASQTAEIGLMWQMLAELQ
jgi:uncharacterized protein (DUF305 family)